MTIAFHGIPIQSLWTAVRWLPGFVLRYFFSPGRLSALQYVDLQPRGESTKIDLGELARYTVWINIINLSPFAVELDRAEFELWFAGTQIKSQVLSRQWISPGELATIQLSGVISDGHADVMARTLRLNPSAEGTLNGWIDFNCKLRSFKRQVGNLSGVRVSVINVQFRGEKLAM
jgi:hypothetical protein